jgi:hypothetical protein
MYVGWQRLPTNIHFLVKFRILKIHNVLNIKPICLKLWILTNFNKIFPVVRVVTVFNSDEFSEGMLDGHSIIFYEEKEDQSKPTLHDVFIP